MRQNHSPMVPIPCVFYESQIIRPFAVVMIRPWLRVLDLDSRCPKRHLGSCQAYANLDDRSIVLSADGCMEFMTGDPSDPRWPVKCDECGTPLTGPGVHKMVSGDWLYRHSETGAMVPLREMPVGAMWQQTFGHGPHSVHLLRRRGFPETCQSDEDVNAFLALGDPEFAVTLPHLFVRTPGGVWDMDAPSKHGDGWKVEGEPPMITARPSIWYDAPNGWHGYLTMGMLTDC